MATSIHATMEDIGDIRYINTGDWVESCTAIAEHMDGSFELISWQKIAVTADIKALPMPKDKVEDMQAA